MDPDEIEAQMRTWAQSPGAQKLLVQEILASRAYRDYGRHVPMVPPTATMEENHRILTEWWAGGVVLLTRYDEAREAVDAAIRAAVLR